MHVVSEIEAAPAVITSKAKLLSGGDCNGLRWQVWAIDFNFAFTVRAEGAEIHTSPPLFSTAPKAERAAKEWCQSYVAPAPEAVMPAAVDEAAVCGWRIHVLDDRGGYQASLVADDDVTAVEALPTCETHQDAVTAAIEWARENPRGAIADLSTPFDDTTDPRPLGVHTGEQESPAGRKELQPLRPAGDAVHPAPPAPTAEPAPAPTPAPATPPEPSRDWSTVDEVWTLLAERDAVDDRLALAEAAKQRAAAQAKEIRSELEELDARIRVARNNAERQRVLPLHPAPRTFATSELRAKIGADATWAFNGVEHRILHEQVPSSDGPRFVAWLDGHRPLTEGHGETLEQALEASRLAASSVWADADPGQTTPSVDTGAVADGPRTPAKRGRPAKLKGHDKAAVIAAVESVLTWPEAADILGCSKAQLEAYASKVGINLAKSQGRHAGEELALPAAPQAKAGRPRGRRYGATPKGGAT